MIDFDNLKQDEYTLAEIARLIKIDPRTVSADFYRLKLPTVKKMAVANKNIGNFRMRSRKPICYASKETVEKYITYVSMKRKN